MLFCGLRFEVMQPSSFPENVDVTGDVVQTLPLYVMFWMEKVNRIQWPLNSKFVLTQLILPWPGRQAVTADFGHAANLQSPLHPKTLTHALTHTYSSCSFSLTNLPLLPFIHLFRNISHLSIYPRPAIPLSSRQPLASLWECFSVHNGACSQTVAECKHQTAS